MRLHDVPPEHLVRADAAVIAALWRRKTGGRQSERPRAFEERVFLLDSEPGVEALEALRHLAVRPAHVRRVWLAVDQHHLAEHELVVVSADRVRAREYGLQNAVGLVTGRLLGTRSVEGPDGRLFARGHDLGLRTQLLRRLGAVDPDVLSPVDVHELPSLAVWVASRRTVAAMRGPVDRQSGAKRLCGPGDHPHRHS